MNKIVVTYETFHGSAKKIADVISTYLECLCINIDTPFEIENLEEIDTLILVFNFRGPYTAQLTKLYLNRVKEQIKNKNVILIGEGLFSEKEFPIVADEINKNYPSKTFNMFFVNGQLRVNSLSREEKILLDKFSELTGMEIHDMGELDLNKAKEVAQKIEELISDGLFMNYNNDCENVEVKEKEIKWVCPICGYIHYGDKAPDVCPVCGVSSDTFVKEA